MEARDVIAHLLHERHPFGYPATLSPFDDSDAILTALHDAGFDVVERQPGIDYDQLQRINEHTRRPYRVGSDQP